MAEIFVPHPVVDGPANPDDMPAGHGKRNEKFRSFFKMPPLRFWGVENQLNSR